MAVLNGHGTTAAWTTATTLNALKVMSIQPLNPTIQTIRTSDLTTATAHTHIASSLREEGEFVITYQYDPTIAIAIGGSAETLTIAWGGAGTTNESVGSAIRTGFQISTVEVDSAELMTVAVTCKCTGAWTHQQN